MKVRETKAMIVQWAMLGSLAHAMALAADEDNSALFLRRKRINSETIGLRKKLQVARDYKESDALEDLWGHAASELELSRLLQRGGGGGDFSMSMPTTPPGPTRSPTPAPTPKPTTSPAPTREPRPSPQPSTLPTATASPTRGSPTLAPTTLSPTLSPAPSSAPTESCFAGQTREEYLLPILLEVTDSDILLDPSTPQGMAFRYMVDEDPFNPCLTTVEQRYALTTLYFSTRGETWTKSDEWLGEMQECEWFGVICANLADRSQVTGLRLANNNLDGPIPDEISALIMTDELDFFANALTGTIPTGITSLTSMALLDVSENLLTGEPFPTSILGLDQLTIYRIGSNELVGPIPSEITGLTSLKELSAPNSGLTGTLPSELGVLRQLESLFLFGNDLVGSIPSELGRLPLKDLRLQQNNFQEEIPSDLFNIGSLETIRLDSNFFFGPLPATIAQLTNLQEFRVDNNNLSGQIPTEIGFLTNLENLLLNVNFWTGTIPDVFGNYEKLDFFDISNNMVGGSIPATLFDIPTLRIAYFSNCSLSGPIPPNYVNPPRLRDLFLDGNQITGTVPPVPVGRLLQLNEFLLHRTRLMGSMPASVCNLRIEENLDDLWSDCGGNSPEIDCDFPDCCNRCFEGGASRRLELREGDARQ